MVDVKRARKEAIADIKSTDLFVTVSLSKKKTRIIRYGLPDTMDPQDFSIILSGLTKAASELSEGLVDSHLKAKINDDSK